MPVGSKLVVTGAVLDDYLRVQWRWAWEEWLDWRPSRCLPAPKPRLRCTSCALRALVFLPASPVLSEAWGLVGKFSALFLGGLLYICVSCVLIHCVYLKPGREELKCSMMPGINSAPDFSKNTVNDQLKWSLRIFCRFLHLFVSLETGWCSGKSRFGVRLTWILLQIITTFQLCDLIKVT